MQNSNESVSFLLYPKFIFAQTPYIGIQHLIFAKINLHLPCDGPTLMVEGSQPKYLKNFSLNILCKCCSGVLASFFWKLKKICIPRKK